MTRAREQAGELVESLEAMGAEAIEAPMIQVLPPSDYAPLDDACARAGTFDWIIFSSGNAVDVFMERLLGTPQDLRALGGVKLCVGGQRPPSGFRHYRLKVDLIPAEYRAEAVVRARSAKRSASAA